MSALPHYSNMHVPPRRHPLSTAPSHYAVNQGTRGFHAPPPRPATPPKQQEQPPQQKQSSPPLPRQAVKVPPPSPPQIIRDRSRSLEFMRVGMLGEVRLEPTATQSSSLSLVISVSYFLLPQWSASASGQAFRSWLGCHGALVAG